MEFIFLVGNRKVLIFRDNRGVPLEQYLYLIFCCAATKQRVAGSKSSQDSGLSLSPLRILNLGTR